MRYCSHKPVSLWDQILDDSACNENNENKIWISREKLRISKLRTRRTATSFFTIIFFSLRTQKDDVLLSDRLVRLCAVNLNWYSYFDSSVIHQTKKMEHTSKLVFSSSTNSAWCHASLRWHWMSLLRSLYPLPLFDLTPSLSVMCM